LSWSQLLLLVLLHLAVLAGLGAIVLGLGGVFILLALAFGVAWAGHFSTLSLLTWSLLFAAALLAEALEFFLGLLMARSFGATRWGMIGALLGGVVGTIAGTAGWPVVGTLVGALLGSFTGAVAGELLRGGSSKEGVRAGCGAFLGRAAAGTLKLALGIVIAFVTLRAAYLMVAASHS
jgi:uncharacterized protein YqgC (DUF456 family)